MFFFRISDSEQPPVISERELPYISFPPKMRLRKSSLYHNTTPSAEPTATGSGKCERDILFSRLNCSAIRERYRLKADCARMRQITERITADKVNTRPI